MVDLQKNIYTDIDDKEDLLLDLMVLSCIGNYSYSKKNDIKKYLTHLFEVTDTDYDKCLYYMEEQGRMSEKKLFKITIENIVDEQKYVIEYLANKNMRFPDIAMPNLTGKSIFRRTTK